MIHDPRLLDDLQRLPSFPWQGVVYRLMFADYPPTRQNTRGARWNPPGTAAIYCSLERDTAIAEIASRLSLEPVRPRATTTLYTIRVSLARELDLSALELLERLGLPEREFRSDVHTPCQRVGGAVAWLGHDGLLVPSARSAGKNLVIYPTLEELSNDFQILEAESITL